MGLQALTESEAAVTLAEAKDHLRIDGDANDGTLEGFILAATQWIENETRHQLVNRDYLLTLDGFPASREVKLPRVPLASIASVKYRDAAGDLQTFDPSNYAVDVVTKPGRIILKTGANWPTVWAESNSVEVRFTAGYGTEDDVPQILRQAVLMMVGTMFEHREGIITGTIVTTTPLAVESICSQYVWPEVV